MTNGGGPHKAAGDGKGKPKQGKPAAKSGSRTKAAMTAGLTPGKPAKK